MKYSVGKIIKLNKNSLSRFKAKYNLTDEKLEKAIVKETDDDLILIDANRL